ncbi:MAG: TlpA disulfide reductase family protein [Planctomycetota bacterium]|nr:TlpA disulfide reductase family protein [Planctomycetota bacterium]
MSKIALISLALVATFAPVSLATDDILGIGSPAPTLSDVTWLKGEAVSQWEEGHVYILDFWATWCGPCKASIPHINDLQEEMRKDVTVIGVAIWPNDRMVPTADFVDEQGDAMDYTICEDNDGFAADAFMAAAKRRGIPTCMVVGKTGQIEWIGHPMSGMDEAVEQIVADTFDQEAYKKEMEKKAEAEAAADAARNAARPELNALGAGLRSEDWASVLDASDALIDKHPLYATTGSQYKYHALVRLDRKADAARHGRDILNGDFAKDANLLNGLSWFIVDPEGNLNEEQRDLELALFAANKANTLTEKSNPSILDTLARVEFRLGNLASAIRTQQAAIENAPGGEQKEALQVSLDEYIEAAENL